MVEFASNSNGRYRTSSKRKASQIDFKTLAGETYIDDDDDDDEDESNSDPNQIHNHSKGSMDANEKSIRMSLYANKHIHEVLHRTYHPAEDILQTVTDGSILTAANLINPKHDISIHQPILITDTPQSIGMKLPKASGESRASSSSSRGGGSGTSSDAPESATNKKNDASDNANTNTNTNTSMRPPTIRELGAKIGMKQPISVMDVRSQDELEGWNWSDMVDYFEDEDRKCMNISHQQHQSILSSSAMDSTSTSGCASASTSASTSTSTSTSTAIFPSGSSSNAGSPNRPTHRRKRKNIPRVLNQISLEFSNLPLAKYVQSPTFVRELDWIDHIWPHERRTNGDYPRVQYYCLTSTAGCYTDFHIDFGGTSVWYHLISGRKTFLLIPPTDEHLELYEAWLCRKDQNDIYFPDMTKVAKKDGDTNNNKKKGEGEGETATSSSNNKGETNRDTNEEGREGSTCNDNDNEGHELKVKQCICVTLEQGQTFIIPTGWIHAVHTPVDSIVFGGNFLHGLDMRGQLNIHCLETRTRVPAKFRFPSFVQLMYYAGREYFKRLYRLNAIAAMAMAAKKGLDTDRNIQKNDSFAVEVSHVELEGLKTLVAALRMWAVSPSGDANRFGSVAHVGLDCVTSLHDCHGIRIRTMEELLNGLEAEMERHERTLKLRDGNGNGNGVVVPLPVHDVHSRPRPAHAPLCAPAPRLKLSIKRKVHANVPSIKSPVTTIPSVEEGTFIKEPQLEKKHSPSPPKIKLKLGKAMPVPSLSSSSNANIQVENIDDDDDDNDIIPAFTFNSRASDVNANASVSQSLSSPTQPISSTLRNIPSNAIPGNYRGNHVSTTSTMNHDLASRHNGMDDDEWLPENDALIPCAPSTNTSSAHTRRRPSVKKNQVTATARQNKKTKASGAGGGARSRLMKKLKF